MPNLSPMIMNIIKEHINTQFIMNIIWLHINAQFITNDYENYPTNDGPPPHPSG